MLKKVNISHYVLIDQLEIDFTPGFAVMTGETGAGKSIILGALHLLLGGRADAKSIRQSANRCVIEGHFAIDGYGLESFFQENDLDYEPQDTILRRELAITGKSRAFINDTPVTLAQLRELGCRLIDIHSQHQNLALGTESFQLEVVDTLCSQPSIKSDYTEAYLRWNSLQERLTQLQAELDSYNTDREYLEYQLEGLESAKLTAHEQEELEQEAQTLSHAEDITRELSHAWECLDSDDHGAISLIRSSLQALQQAQRNLPQAHELTSRMESCLIELKDIAASTLQVQESIQADPIRLEQVNERLDLIYSLLKKHKKGSVAELIELTRDIKARLQNSENHQYEIEQLTAQLSKARIEMEQQAKLLTAARQEAATIIMERIKEQLVPLGIPNVQFSIAIEPAATYHRTGHDTIKFLFSANRSVPMQELQAVASGGEIARVMLCIKSLMAGARSLPTIVFDEIDTGVSGAVAEQMARLMRQLSSDGHQVLAITHLPQIAAMGQTHYKVFKTDDSVATHTHITMLEGEDRIREIAAMMSGSTLTQAAYDNAKSLIDHN